MSKQSRKVYILVICMLAGAVLAWSVIRFVFKDSTAVLALKDGFRTSSSTKEDTSIYTVNSNIPVQINSLGNIKP